VHAAAPRSRAIAGSRSCGRSLPESARRTQIGGGMQSRTDVVHLWPRPAEGYRRTGVRGTVRRERATEGRNETGPGRVGPGPECGGTGFRRQSLPGSTGRTTGTIVALDLGTCKRVTVPIPGMPQRPGPPLNW
jgi:hypothetical protein